MDNVANARLDVDAIVFIFFYNTDDIVNVHGHGFLVYSLFSGLFMRIILCL